MLNTVDEIEAKIGADLDDRSDALIPNTTLIRVTKDSPLVFIKLSNGLWERTGTSEFYDYGEVLGEIENTTWEVIVP